jgi:hypothetical protein
MTVYLLDVNLLLALSDPMHIYHDVTHRWFAQTGQRAWATCPLTENGYVRVASHAKYPNRPGDVPVVLALLRQFCSTRGHQFWPDEVSIREVLNSDFVLTQAQITDVYLLGLAVHRKGKLASLDQHIPVDAVRRGREALELVSV